jgi:hypothetical protein
MREFQTKQLDLLPYKVAFNLSTEQF